MKKEFIQTCKTCDLTFSSDRPRVKLDYILYSRSSPFACKSEKVINNADTRFASDHLPYVAELVWKDK